MGRAWPKCALQGLWIVAALFSLLAAWNFALAQQVQSPPDLQPDFTVVVLPDTQYYTEGEQGAKMFTAQTRWVAKNKKKQNVKAVIGLGDIVDDGNSTAEWQKADSAYRILDKAGVPYAPVLGNHDYDSLGHAGNRAAKGYNTYFGPSRFSGYSWYGTSYPAGSNENFYIKFSAGPKSYLVLALELYPRAEALEWAQGVVEANPDKKIVVATHSYLLGNGKRIVKGSEGGPQVYGLASANDNDAEEMWTKLIKKDKNIILVVCGHVGPLDGSTVMARSSDVGDNGNLVHQLLADYQFVTNGGKWPPRPPANYQFVPNGGSGYMRVMKFRPSKRIIEVTTYSPFLKANLTDASNLFTLEYSD